MIWVVGILAFIAGGGFILLWMMLAFRAVGSVAPPLQEHEVKDVLEKLKQPRTMWDEPPRDPPEVRTMWDD